MAYTTRILMTVSLIYFQMCPFIMGVTVNDSFENLGDSLIALDESLGNLGQSLLLDDNLGESLFETSDNLGVSLCDSTISEPVGFSETMNDSDNLGYSIIDQVFSDSIEIPEELEADFEAWDRNVNMASTPTKRMTDDVRQYGSVSANLKTSFQFNTKQDKKNKLFSKAMDRKDLVRTMKKGCKCGKNCMSSLTLKNVVTMRCTYWSMTRQSRSQWLIHSIQNADISGRNTYHFVEKGQQLCGVAFRQVYRITKNFYGSCKKLNDRNSVSSVDRSPRSLSVTSLAALNWMESYASFYGDRMPHNKDILLPYKTLRENVYKQYKLDSVEVKSKHVSRTQFYRLWKTYLPQIKIKKTNPFSKCATCSSLEKQLEKTPGAIKRDNIRKMRELHNQRQMMERKYYYSKREQSRRMPTEYLSLIVDGMDQSKSSLPHFTGRRSKVINPADLLKTHITGVINHGQDMFNTYVDYNQFPHDPNLTINILLQSLEKAAERMGNKLPPTLYLQADNCWRENKNKWVLAFLEHLVMKKIFREVHLSFLYVGHTHEDVDAAFSRISEKLRKTDVSTLDDLVNVLPRSEHLSNVFDVKKWLDTSVADPEFHTEPHHYKWESSSQGVSLYFKGNKGDQWESSEDNFLLSVPRGKPKPLKPDTSNIDSARSLKLIKQVKHMFSNTEQSFNWWKKFHDNLKRLPRFTHHWILDELPIQEERTTTNLDDSDPIPEEIQKMLEKEVRVPRLRFKKKKQQGPRNARRPRATAKKSTKSNDKRRRRLERQVSVFCVGCLEEDMKKHIWMIIFWTMWENFVQLSLALFYFWFTDWFFMLVIAGQLTEALEIIQAIWTTLVKIHVGLHFARACVIIDQLHAFFFHRSLGFDVCSSTSLLCF